MGRLGEAVRDEEDDLGAAGFAIGDVELLSRAVELGEAIADVGEADTAAEGGGGVD